MNRPQSGRRAGQADDILFVVGSLQIGGAERHLASVAAALHRRGRRVAVYNLAGTGPLYTEIKQSGVKVLLPVVQRGTASIGLVLRVLRLLLTAFHLFSVMVRRKPAVVHFFLPEAYVTGAPLAVLSRRRVLVMSRRSLNVYQTRRPVLGWFERRMHRWVTAFLGNSASVLRDLKNEGIAEDRLGLIYNGIDTSRHVPNVERDTMRASLGLSKDSLAMVIVANLIPYKGHSDLLAAVGRAKGRLPPNWRLLVVGRDDGIEAGLREMAGALHISENVSFLGLRSDVVNILWASDIGILSSHEEGFSNSILEGMAARLPMIVTDVGGNAEAVIDGECGFVVPPRDPVRLAGAIEVLARDPDLRAAFGAAGRRRIEQRFTLEKCVDAYDALYSGLLAGKKPKDIAAVRPD